MTSVWVWTVSAATRCPEGISSRQSHLWVWISSERYRLEITRLGDNNEQGVIKVLKGYELTSKECS